MYSTTNATACSLISSSLKFQEVSCNLGLFSTSGEGEGTGGSLRRGEDVRVEATWFIAVGIALDVR